MITPLPIPPSRQDPANFSQRADAFMGALPTFATETNAIATDVNNAVIAANASAVDAAVSATGANASANVSKWVSGTTYAQGDVEWSPLNFFSYRRKIDGAGTTDPSADPTNWALVSGAGDVSLTGVQTLTNKTLTSPVINSPVINTPVINTPVINSPVINSINGGQLAGMRNRIINGDMRIDQRNNGGGVSITGAVAYTVDRSFSTASGANLTGNRTASGLAGLPFATQFIGAVGNTAASLAQRIEASSIQDFVAGTTITISAYVYSSAAFTPTWRWLTATTTDATYATVAATGSFAAVPAATWIRVSATFNAPANTTNGSEVDIILGSTVSGVTKLVTGLQVELGSVATPFEQRPYGLELMLCQRYYYRDFPGAVNRLMNAFGANYTTTSARVNTTFPTPMRVAPTALEAGTFNWYGISQAGIGTIQCSVSPLFSTASPYNATTTLTVASGLTTFQPVTCVTDAVNGASAYLGWSAEL